MFFIITSITVIILFFYIYTLFIKSKWNNLIEYPGPKGYPLIGSLFSIKSPNYHSFYELTKQYGKIYTLKFGLRKILIMNDYEFIKKTMKSDLFTGRIDTMVINVLCNNHGILRAQGSLWSENRQFIMKTFRDFGLGKSKSEEIINTECEYLLNELENSNQQKIDFNELISYCTGNIITCFTMNKRFDRNDRMLKFSKKLIDTFARSSDPYFILELLYPFLFKNKTLINFILYIHGRKKIMSDLYGEIDDIIKEHEEKLCSKTEPEDYIDCYIEHMKHLNDKYGCDKHYFSKWQLIVACSELFLAGYDTTSATLGWALFFVAYYNDYQHKINDEIINEIGLERTITINDKRNLSFTQAFLDEVLRFGTTVPLALLHKANDNVQIDDYHFIPKDRLIFYNIYGVHRDERIWKKPFEFYPNHFLDDNNNYKPNEALIPFGVGKRQCLGESLARMEYFLFFTNIIRNFKIKMTQDVSIDEYNDILRGNEGIIRFCKRKEFIFEKRI